jgi:eukaryotic-like serine/threonine-protein kinase
VGTYKKKRLLGSGSYGEVHLATHEALLVDHAVKYIQTSRVRTPTNLFHEPQLLKQLEHPNIVAVHDAGYVTPDEIFIAMEYVIGGSLEAFLAKKPIKLRRIKHIFCEALRGLQHAHEKGYVHRDVKPANILLDRKQKGKLSDFGLATRPPVAGIASGTGSPFYSAPETIHHDETSHLSDIYSMGVSLYEAVNGESYFPPVADLASLYSQITCGAFPDRSYYRIYVPTSLQKVINKAMNVDKSQRFQSAEEFREALEQTPIKCSWKEHTAGRTTTWTAVLDDRKIQVVLTEGTAGRSSIDVLQRTQGASQYRYVKKLQLKNVPRAKAMSRVRKITTSLVNGRRLADINP